MSKSEKKLKRNEAIAILLYNQMEPGVRYPTTHFMRLFEVNQQMLYKPISMLLNLKLIKAYNGNAKGGLEKIKEVSVESLCKMLNVKYIQDVSIVDRCDEVIDVSRKSSVCDICSESVLYVDRDNVCNSCSLLEEPSVAPKLARCGHLSTKRYFTCEECQPELESDYDDMYSFVKPRRSVV